MDKVKIVITDELKYQREAIIFMPDGRPGTIDELLNKAEENANTSVDIIEQLKKQGCRVVQNVSIDFDAPVFAQAEVTDYEIVD